MRLATIRLDDGGTAAVRIDDDAAVEIGADDLTRFLARPDWRSDAAAATGPRHELDSLDYAPLVPRPDKVVCVGLNYRTHIEEMGRELPSHPTLFAKYSGALVGAFDKFRKIKDCVFYEKNLQSNPTVHNAVKKSRKRNRDDDSDVYALPKTTDKVQHAVNVTKKAVGSKLARFSSGVANFGVDISIK